MLDPVAIDTDLREEASALLRRLVACDTSNPPGRETQAVAILEDYLAAAGLECERVAKDPERANLIARLPGRGSGPSLAFLGHFDVVVARREEWSVEPFAAVERDGAIWGRGTVDMKGQVAASAVALAALAREGFRPAGDLMLLVMADEEVGEAEVGAPYFVEQRPDLCPDFVVGEGAGERYDTTAGPVYLLDHGVKATATATVTVRGRPGDASLSDAGPNALYEVGRLLARLEAYRSPVRIPAQVEPLIDALAPGDAPPHERLAAARVTHPAIDRVFGALVGTTFQPSVLEAPAPQNVVPATATLTIACGPLPGTTGEQLEAELREALGDGEYEIELTTPPKGGSISDEDSPLRDAIEEFLGAEDPQARLIPTLGYGYSDCHVLREAYGCIAYGFIPFRYGDAVVNLETKHGADERVLVDDLEFQTRAALAIARTIGSQE
ncbi:M20/M25/M40 family metallo-hydrolase [Candidatus Solirubrobacter pratensis]|uniref:M20/M25/M40 family metallo-hydrolase n=1 Tax=Candidatus Solirubrobacter pratensis TaxID=1298857 RepID=UPI0004232943|nr:M20/M25/M40 family metallo-hydrolase [Candidatus Solirubrobacter pratensis]